jgi:signal transduction histidine kinase
MAKPLRALIVEDSEDDCALLLRLLRQGGYEVQHRRVDSAETLRASLDSGTWHIVISDYSIPGFSGVAALEIVREKDPDVPFIFFSGTIGERIAVEAMKVGAQDSIMKGNLARLLPAIGREVREAEGRRERRRVEQQIRRLEKFEAIGRVAGGVAHDFNNVIGAIMVWAELGNEAAPAGNPGAEYFRKIHALAERAAGLTRQLLAFAGRQILEPRNINLNEIVRDVAPLLEKAMREQIEMKLTLASDLPTTRADPARLEQVLMNLCFNARDAMPRGAAC